MRSDKAHAATAAAIGAFLRALAERAERDAAFAQGVAEALAQSGLLAPTRARRGATRPVARASEAAVPESAGHGGALDPFAALRGEGETGLRAALDALEIAALHQIVRTYRLDPARISARWTTRARLIELIVTQVRARANHGQAFARV
jgi:hypothetical protein